MDRKLEINLKLFEFTKTKLINFDKPDEHKTEYALDLLCLNINDRYFNSLFYIVYLGRKIFGLNLFFIPLINLSHHEVSEDIWIGEDEYYE